MKEPSRSATCWGGTAGLTGNSLIDNVNISGSIEHHIEVYNQTGTMNLTIRNSNIHDNSVAGGSDGIQMEIRGNAASTVNIANNFLQQQQIPGASSSPALEDSNLQATISGNTITRGTQGNEGIVIANGGNADARVLIGSPTAAQGNTISGFGGVAVSSDRSPVRARTVAARGDNSTQHRHLAGERDQPRDPRIRQQSDRTGVAVEIPDRQQHGQLQQRCGTRGSSV